MAKFKNEKIQCFCCQKQFEAQTIAADLEPHCPFCQSPVAPTLADDSLEKITGLALLGTVDWEAPAKVYIVERGNEKFLMTLLDEGSTIYSMWKRAHEIGQGDPYQSTSIELISSSDGLEKEEVMLYCQTSVWETERTYATLNITPGPMGTRQLVASFSSFSHRHLFPQQ